MRHSSPISPNLSPPLASTGPRSGASPQHAFSTQAPSYLPTTRNPKRPLELPSDSTAPSSSAKRARHSDSSTQDLCPTLPPSPHTETSALLHSLIHTFDTLIFDDKKGPSSDPSTVSVELTLTQLCTLSTCKDARHHVSDLCRLVDTITFHLNKSPFIQHALLLTLTIFKEQILPSFSDITALRDSDHAPGDNISRSYEPHLQITEDALLRLFFRIRHSESLLPTASVFTPGSSHEAPINDELSTLCELTKTVLDTTLKNYLSTRFKNSELLLLSMKSTSAPVNSLLGSPLTQQESDRLRALKLARVSPTEYIQKHLSETLDTSSLARRTRQISSGNSKYPLSQKYFHPQASTKIVKPIFERQKQHIEDLSKNASVCLLPNNPRKCYFHPSLLTDKRSIRASHAKQVHFPVNVMNKRKLLRTPKPESEAKRIAFSNMRRSKARLQNIVGRFNTPSLPFAILCDIEDVLRTRNIENPHRFLTETASVDAALYDKVHKQQALTSEETDTIITQLSDAFEIVKNS